MTLSVEESEGFWDDVKAHHLRRHPSRADDERYIARVIFVILSAILLIVAIAAVFV